MPITQERLASRSRKSTARISAGRPPHNDRTASRLLGPGFIVATRKIAARVSGADTGCGTAPDSTPAFGEVIEIASPLHGSRQRYPKSHPPPSLPCQRWVGEGRILRANRTSWDDGGGTSPPNSCSISPPRRSSYGLRD